jgi:hypothetical protein
MIAVVDDLKKKHFVRLHTKRSPMVVQVGGKSIEIHLDIVMEEHGVETEDFDDNVIMPDGSYMLVKAGTCYDENEVPYAWLHKHSLEMDHFLTYREAKLLTELNFFLPLRRKLRYKNRKSRAALRHMKKYEIGRLWLRGFEPRLITARETG